MAKTQSDYKPRSQVQILSDQFTHDESNLSVVRGTWDDKEAMLLGVPLDSQSKQSQSQVFDPRLSTIVYERAARVTAQLPSGKVQALTKHDTGKNMLMNLTLTRYVYPNARSQYDLLTKNKLWDVYSNVYGSFAVLVDYMVRDDYIGPDYMLIPIRNVIPQSGKSQDFDYVFVRSKVSKSWLTKRDTKNWKNIDKLLAKTMSGKSDDANKQSFIEREFNPQQLLEFQRDEANDIEIITKYSPDRWITFSKDHSIIIRDIPNPHSNGRIPVVWKHAFPLLDRAIGLGEFERGQTLQFAVNSLINLYLDGVKMSIFPPLKVYLPDLVAKTFQYEPAAKWILKNPNQNAVTQMQFSPAGITTFQSTYQFLIGAILNQAGTTDTTVPAGADFSQGKTPQALKQLAMRENARDSWDRFMLEKALEETFNIFVDLIANKQEKPIKMELFDDEIKMIKESNPDLAEMFDSGKYGQVTVKPSDLRGGKESKDKKGAGSTVKYRYFIDAGTTMKKDDEDQNATLTSLLTFVLKLPGAIDEAKQTGKVMLGDKTIDIGETFKQWVNTSGINAPDKIIADKAPQDLNNPGAANAGAQPQDAAALLAGGAGGGMPQPMPAGQPAPGGGQPMPQDAAALLAGQQEKAKVSVSVKADANTPVGQELLKESGALSQNVPAVPAPDNAAAQAGQPPMTEPSSSGQVDTSGSVGQPGQGVNFEDPRIQELLAQNGQSDPTQSIMDELTAIGNGPAGGPAIGQ